MTKRSSRAHPPARTPALRVGYRNHGGRDAKSILKAERAIAHRSAVSHVLDPEIALYADELSPGMLRISTAAIWTAVEATTGGPAAHRTRLGLPVEGACAVRPIVRAAHRLGIGAAIEHALCTRGDRDVHTALVDVAQTVSALELLYVEAGKRDRRIIRRLLSHPDTPAGLHRELSEEVAIRAAHTPDGYTGANACTTNRRAESIRSWGNNEAARAYAHGRLMRELAAAADRLSADVGCTSSVIAILENAGLRQLLAKLVRHERNMREIAEGGTPGRASRAKILFERSWENSVARARKQVEDKVLILPPGPPGYRYNNAILAAEKRTGSILDEDAKTETTRAGSLSPGNISPLGVFWTKLGVAEQAQTCACPAISTAETFASAFLDGAGSAAGEEQAGPHTTPGRAEARAEEIALMFSRQRPSVAVCDQIGEEIWSDGSLLSEILVRHRELPDRLLAGIKRASVRDGGHLNPQPPVRPQQLLERLGATGTAELLRRLRTVRVQWPKEEQPPRYVRHTVSRVEWRTAARFLVHEGSEAAWLTGDGIGGLRTADLEAGCEGLDDCDLTTQGGRDMYHMLRERCVLSQLADAGVECLLPGGDIEEAVAQCVTLLGVESLAEYRRDELVEILYAAGGYDLTRVNAALAAATRAPRGRGWEAASTVLAAQLSDHELETALNLLESWVGTLQELIDIAQYLSNGRPAT